MSFKKIIVYGLGSLSEIFTFTLENDSEDQIVAYTIHEKNLAALKTRPDFIKQKKIIPFEEIETQYPPEDFSLFIAIGYAKMNEIRQKYFKEAKDKGYQLYSHICRKNTIWPTLEVGENVLIWEHNNLQPFVKIEDGVIISRGNSIGHNSTIGAFSFIANHAVFCGFNTVGPKCFIGSNATISDGVNIGESTLVGASAFITRDTAEGSAYVAAYTPPSQKKSSDFFNW